MTLMHVVTLIIMCNTLPWLTVYIDYIYIYILLFKFCEKVLNVRETIKDNFELICIIILKLIIQYSLFYVH